MSAVLEAPPMIPRSSSTTPVPMRKSPAPRPLRWTVAEFYRLFQLPNFQDRKCLLIDGEIIEMPNPGPMHVAVITIAYHALCRLFGDGFLVRNQGGLPLGLDTDPIPDLSVVTGNVRDYLHAHPTIDRVRLVAEISDSTLLQDLRAKSHLYAAGGVSEYWVIDVNASQLHVFREPVADEAAPRGFRYASIQVLNPTDPMNPLAAPDSQFAVGELMP